MILFDSELGLRGLPLSETQPSFPTSGVIFGRDPSSSQAENMGRWSGVPFTLQRQLDLYVGLREKGLESDQVVYSMVLEQTGGPVDVFKAKYPHIDFNRI